MTAARNVYVDQARAFKDETPKVPFVNPDRTPYYLDTDFFWQEKKYRESGTRPI